MLLAYTHTMSTKGGKAYRIKLAERTAKLVDDVEKAKKKKWYVPADELKSASNVRKGFGMHLKNKDYAKKVLAGSGQLSAGANTKAKEGRSAAAAKRKQRAAKMAKKRETGKSKPMAKKAKKPKSTPKKRGRPKLTEQQKKDNKAKRKLERATKRKNDPDYKPRPRKKVKHADKTDKELREYMQSLTREGGTKRQCSDAFINSVIERRKAARERIKAQQSPRGRPTDGIWARRWKITGKRQTVGQ